MDCTLWGLVGGDGLGGGWGSRRVCTLHEVWLVGGMFEGISWRLFIGNFLGLV